MKIELVKVWGELIESYASIWRYRRFLAWNLEYERRASYTGMLLGSLWALLTPIVQIAVYYFLVNVIFGRSGTSGLDPFMVIAVGILHFTLFMSMISTACNSVISRAGILLNLNVRPIVFIALHWLSGVRTGIDYLLVLAVVFIVMRELPGPQFILYPFLLIFGLSIVFAASIMLGVVSVFLRDMPNIIQIFTRILLYLTPVIYHFTFVPVEYWTIYFLNPISGYFAWLQWTLLGGPMPPLAALIWSFVFGTVIFVVSHVVYVRAAPHVSKRL